MNDRKTALSKPPIFTVGANITIHYGSNRSEREQYVTGEIVADEGGVLTIEEYSLGKRYNEHRTIEYEEQTHDVYSVTEERRTKLGPATEVSLSLPPWETRADKIATGFATYASFQNKWVHEGIYKFPDPDFMEKPDGWEP